MAVTPIFLFSLPRSGSTLLQRMLAGHPEVNAHSELWFLLPHIDAIENRFCQAVYSTNSLANATKSLVERLPCREADYYSAVRCMSDSLYANLAGENERYVVDKTPRYYFIIREIERLYPDAKYIFLFRHPFSVAGSLVESFFGGRLGDYRHRIDIFEGPRLLAEGYRNFGASNIALKYEDLVSEPEVWLEKICKYLEIPYVDKMVSGFAGVPVGEMGDQFGSRRHTSLTTDPIEKWRNVFDTKYRKKYLQKLLAYWGRPTVECFGYDFDELQSSVDSLPARTTLALEDRMREVTCQLYSLLEIPLLHKKYKQQKQTGGHYYIHH